ncbi:MAG: hypothetical protein ACI4O7_09300 [Aristaeellaceae bacterium]
MDHDALTLLVNQPARVARWCGADRLRDEPHGRWIRQMLLGERDMTLLAHRGSFKTTCLCCAIAIGLLVYPEKNMIFLRKTDGDVTEVLRQVKDLLRADAMQALSARLWGQPVRLVRGDQFSLTTSCYTARRGAAQLLGQGIRGSLTGKHADLILTDDIVNLQDRLSPTERAYTRAVYRELQNIRNPGGRIINAGTPWHRDDAISLMPNPQRWDVRRTRLLSRSQVDALRRSMPPSLFAANYELRHMASEDALFAGEPAFAPDTACLQGGIAHLDAAYGGSDCTALTLGRREGDRICLYGRLWKGHVDGALEEILRLCEALGCSPIHVETNGDKGYLAREIRGRGFPVRCYHERADKHHKIATFLYKWWPSLLFVPGTDTAYIRQIQDYGPGAAHDDAPDSAACLLRLLDRPAYP